FAVLAYHQGRTLRTRTDCAYGLVCGTADRNRQHREIGGRCAMGHISRLLSALGQADFDQNVTVVRHVHKVCEGNHTSLMQYDLRAEREEQGERIGETKASPDAATDGGAVTELHAND